MLTKGNFTRDEWNHLLCLFNISHFSSTNCSEVMSKRTQKDSRWRKIHSEVKTNDEVDCAKHREAHISSVIFCIRSPGKTRQESQNPLSSQAEKYDRTVRPVVCSEGAHRPVVYAHSSSYSEWNVDRTWSSQEWKSDELMDDRTVRPVVCSQRASQTRFSCEYKNVILEEEENHDRTGRPVVCHQRGRPWHFVIEDDEAESDLSLGSRSFLHRVNDQVRKRQKQYSMDVTEDSEPHSVILGMFMSSTLQASVFMGKNYSDNWHSIKNSKRSHNETDARNIWKIDTRTIRWDLWSENNWLEESFMEIYVFHWWWKSYQSLAHKGLRILRFCIVSW